MMEDTAMVIDQEEEPPLPPLDNNNNNTTTTTSTTALEVVIPTAPPPPPPLPTAAAATTTEQAPPAQSETTSHSNTSSSINNNNNIQQKTDEKVKEKIRAKRNSTTRQLRSSDDRIKQKLKKQTQQQTQQQQRKSLRSDEKTKKQQQQRLSKKEKEQRKASASGAAAAAAAGVVSGTSSSTTTKQEKLDERTKQNIKKQRRETLRHCKQQQQQQQQAQQQQSLEQEEEEKDDEIKRKKKEQKVKHHLEERKEKKKRIRRRRRTLNSSKQKKGNSSSSSSVKMLPKDGKEGINVGVGVVVVANEENQNNKSTATLELAPNLNEEPDFVVSSLEEEKESERSSSSSRIVDAEVQLAPPSLPPGEGGDIETGNNSRSYDNDDGDPSDYSSSNFDSVSFLVEEEEDSYYDEHDDDENDDDENEVYVQEKQQTLKKWCTKNSTILIGVCILTFVLVIAVVVPIAITSGKGGGGGDNGNGNQNTNNGVVATTTNPPITVTTTTSSTDRVYTLPPPVPDLSLDMNAPPTSTSSWSTNNNNYTTTTTTDNLLVGFDKGVRFGHASSISYDGTVLATSLYAYENGRGKVSTFKWDGSTWSEFGLVPEGEGGGGGGATEMMVGDHIGSHFGASLSLSGDGSTLIVGEPDYSSSSSSSSSSKEGRFRIFHYDGENDVWKEEASVVGDSVGDNFGFSVDINYDGSVVVIGAPNGDANSKVDAGYVRVYELQSRQGWKLMGGTTGTTGTTNSGGLEKEQQQTQATLSGQTTLDYFGTSVSMSASGMRIAVGIPGDDHAGDKAGAASVFDYNVQSGDWIQAGFGENLKGVTSRVQAGTAVSLSGDGLRLSIAYPRFNFGGREETGLIRVYQNVLSNAARWEQVGNDLYGSEEGEQIGFRVELNFDGTILAYSSVTYNEGRGRVDLYQNVDENVVDSVWNKMNTDGMITGLETSDSTGRSIGLSASGYRMVVGTDFGDKNGWSSGHVSVYEY